ncbi:hypothetical protein [Mucilaginibacter sp. NFX135]|uniref:hypothetical protein n=1 Tax=Mucilaginibacter sp. NFX135 TaxID=3402687 RepID=UPI003AFAAB3C
MTFTNRIAAVLLVLIFYAGNNTAYAQLWRYLNDSPGAEKAADMALKKEAFSVITKRIIAYGDTFSYDVMTYAIRSFDGRPAKISLWEKPFSDRIFHIDLPDDNLIIPDFYCLTRVRHLSNDILEIVYSPRGGSDQGFDNVLLLGVNKGKFSVVMEILSINEYDGPGEYGLYNLHLKLSGKNVNDYQLALHVRDLLKSDNPKKSFDRSGNYMLKFDKSLHIFYNEMRSMNAVVELYDTKTSKTKLRQIKGSYPVIKLGEYEYIFLNGLWYEVTKDHATGKYFFSPNSIRPGHKK